MILTLKGVFLLLLSWVLSPRHTLLEVFRCVHIRSHIAIIKISWYLAIQVRCEQCCIFATVSSLFFLVVSTYFFCLSCHTVWSVSRFKEKRALSHCGNTISVSCETESLQRVEQKLWYPWQEAFSNSWQIRRDIMANSFPVLLWSFI